MAELSIQIVFISSFLLAIAVILIRISKGQFQHLLPAIILLGLIVRCYTASDNFLHEWDEKYHALVAKNLIAEPLQPALYRNPVLPYHPDNWVENHIWLEKGPVPLFLMAASLKVFGINEYALRLPSLLLSLLAVYLTYLIGKRLFNERIALLAAFFHSINGLIIEVAAGRVSSDHVETVYIVLFELILFFIIKNLVNDGRGRRYSAPTLYLYPFLIGTFAGLAFLTKWTPVLMIFPVWLIMEFVTGSKSKKQIFIQFGIAILIFLLITVPALLYIRQEFPAEARHVLLKFILAFNQPVESHQGPLYYYFLNITMVYGELIWLPLIIGIIHSIMKKDWRLILLALWWIIPFIFFSLAATKRHTYLLIAAPAIIIILSYSIVYISESFYSKRKVLSITATALLVLLPVRYCIERVKPFKHDFIEPSWVSELKSFNGKYPKNTVIFNCEHAIEGMFYTDYIFYTRYPINSEKEELERKGYTVIVM